MCSRGPRWWSLSAVLALAVLGCERDVAAVLSISLHGPTGGSSRSFTVDLSVGSGHHTLSFSGNEEKTFNVPRRLDVTFREGQTGEGFVDVSAVNSMTHQALRGCGPVTVLADRTNTVDIDLLVDDGRCDLLGAGGQGAGGQGGGAGAGGRGGSGASGSGGSSGASGGGSGASGRGGSGASGTGGRGGAGMTGGAGMAGVGGSDPCRTHATCGSCAPVEGCGWCEGSLSCRAGTGAGPTVGSCAFWDFNPNECPGAGGSGGSGGSGGTGLSCDPGATTTGGTCPTGLACFFTTNIPPRAGAQCVEPTVMGMPPTSCMGLGQRSSDNVLVYDCPPGYYCGPPVPGGSNMCLRVCRAGHQEDCPIFTCEPYFTGVAFGLCK